MRYMFVLLRKGYPQLEDIVRIDMPADNAPLGDRCDCLVPRQAHDLFGSVAR